MKKKINSFKINVTTQTHNLPDSFFDCKYISDSLQCIISNDCLSSKGLSFFGYENNIQMKNFSFILDPMKNPENLDVFVEDNFNENYFSNVPAIYADLHTRFTAFFHLVTETVFPFCRLFTDLNLLNTSKLIVLKKNPRSILQYFPILNANVTYLNEKKCYKKVIIGFPKYNGFYDPKFSNFLDPELFNYKYRKIWRSLHENYFEQNRNDQKINLLFLNRPATNHRSILNYNQIISAIKSVYPDWNIVYQDFANESLYNQIKLVLKTDILITIHGSAETHMLLLNDNSLTIEIMPYLLDKFINLYSNLANMTKLKFYEFHASKSSSIPKRRKWISEYEINPKVLCNGIYRNNIRNQNIVLNETEINILLKLIKDHIK